LYLALHISWNWWGITDVIFWSCKKGSAIPHQPMHAYCGYLHSLKYSYSDVYYSVNVEDAVEMMSFYKLLCVTGKMHHLKGLIMAQNHQ
jgi:hypothetical protein